MKISVISASPKGKNSITVQSAFYLEKHYPYVEFDIIHVGNKVKIYSQAKEMDACISRMADSDLIMFVYPVYTFLAPYQLARFIRIIKSRPNSKKLEGKFATQISTSKHFYDTTAHRYIMDNCSDMGLKNITGLAADMDDLLSKDGRKQLNDFFTSVQFSIENNIYKSIGTVSNRPFDFIYNGKPKETKKTAGFDTVIVTDCSDDNISLRHMINAFISTYTYPVREINLSKFKFSGGCLGCFECATDGTCIYKDGFEKMLRSDVQNADVTILAGSVIDHSMGPIFKCYDDRQFCNGHRVLTKGKAVGYILDGRLSNERNLLDLIESRSEVSHTYLAGIATNESENDEIITKSIEDLSKSIVFCMGNKLERPQNFFGIGGMKIFRDLIFIMRGLMKEDHAFYKKHDIYDFPHKQKSLILRMQLIGLLLSIPAIKKRAQGKMNAFILKPYKKAIDGK